VAEKDCTEVGLAEKSEPTAGEKIENEKLEGVKVQEAIIKLKLLGQMPDAVKDDPTEETINMYDELLSNVKTPLTREEVGVLIDIFPEGGMYGVEWDLLKLVESYLIEAPSSEEYRKLITACPSEEWREILYLMLNPCTSLEIFKKDGTVVTKSFKERIAPTGLKIGEKDIILGDSYIGVVTLRTYPSLVSVGWLGAVSNVEHTRMILSITPMDSYEISNTLKIYEFCDTV